MIIDKIFVYIKILILWPFYNQVPADTIVCLVSSPKKLRRANCLSPADMLF